MTNLPRLNTVGRIIFPIYAAGEIVCTNVQQTKYLLTEHNNQLTIHQSPQFRSWNYEVSGRKYNTSNCQCNNFLDKETKQRIKKKKSSEEIVKELQETALNRSGDSIY